jgi:hypothetical protein
MELHGETYLFNLSLLAITFAAVSALVMLIRQTMGGKLSNFDIYLIASYVSCGFAQALAAILPPLVSLFELPKAALWAISSVLAAILIGGVIFNVVRLRRNVSPEPMASAQVLSLSMHGVAIIVFLINAAVLPWQGVHLFALAVTLSVAGVMWAFVRRVSSLLGDKPGEDWDPKRG